MKNPSAKLWKKSPINILPASGIFLVCTTDGISFAVTIIDFELTTFPSVVVVTSLVSFDAIVALPSSDIGSSAETFGFSSVLNSLPSSRLAF